MVRLLKFHEATSREILGPARWGSFFDSDDFFLAAEIISALSSAQKVRCQPGHGRRLCAVGPS